MIFVIATIQLKPGRREQFLDHFRDLVPKVRQEKGCLLYVPTTDVETTLPAQGEPRPDAVTVVEHWESIETLQDHLMAPHMLEYRNLVQDLVQEISLQITEPAS